MVADGWPGLGIDDAFVAGEERRMEIQMFVAVV